MKNILALSLCALAAFGCKSTDSSATESAKEQKYDIAAYYWPAYHPEPRWAELGVFGDGKGEWQNVYEAKPKHEGHDQPRVPLLGYQDESKPEVMAQKIDLATKYGVNVMIFDWYWYEDKPFLEEALNSGFLKAPNNHKMKFYIMWANHDVNLTWNNKIAKKNGKIFWRGGVSAEVFKHIADRMAEKYFKQPNYYKINGKPVFCIYELNTFIKGVGGLEQAKKSLDYMRAKADAAGCGVHIQTIAWNLPKDLQGVPGDPNPTSEKISKYLGIDSYTSYQWVHYKAPRGEHKDWADFNVKNWDNLAKGTIPFYNHVSIGWDNNPRFPQAISYIKNSTPSEFEKYLRIAKEWTDKHNPQQRLITINSWNEWTEGSYLEPDKSYGYKMLEAVKKVFVDEK
jgi:hypothetical protein